MNRTTKPMALTAFIAVVGLTTLVLYHLGWLHKPQDWRQATGWDRIPADLRPRNPEPVGNAHAIANVPRIRWLGHSGFAIEWNGQRLLTDPVLESRCTVSKCVLERHADARDIADVDIVLISHAHYDHLDIPTLTKIPKLKTVVVPAGVENYLPDSLRQRVQIRSLTPGDKFLASGLEVVAIHAVHNSARNHPFANGCPALGYVVRSPDYCLYYAGDSAFGNDFDGIGKTYRPNLAILPIGGFSPAVPLQRYHLNPEEAAEAAAALGVDCVIPCHFGTFTVSLDRPAAALPRFALACHRLGVTWRMPMLASGVDDETVVAGTGDGSAEARRITERSL